MNILCFCWFLFVGSAGQGCDLVGLRHFGLLVGNLFSNVLIYSLFNVQLIFYQESRFVSISEREEKKSRFPDGKFMMADK